MLSMLSVFTLAACGGNGGAAAKINIELLDVEDLTAETGRKVTDSACQGEKNLLIDADVELGDMGRLFEITVKSDEKYVHKFINEQIKPKYPEISEDKDETGSRMWNCEKDGQLLLSCTVESDGVLHYVDVLKDVNTPYLDAGEHILEYGYITELDAPGVGLSAREAAEVSASYLEEYSSFDFRPWNILAGDRPDEIEKTGYYFISMQPMYEGVPVSVKRDSTMPGFSTTIAYAGDGIFQIHGAFMFSVSDSIKIERIVSLDSVLEKFKSNFAAFSEGDSISVNRITLEYFPQVNGNSSYTLLPVWNIYCTDTRTEEIDGKENTILLHYSYLYFAKDGELCGIYY